jgi:protein-disulfide isomerase
MFREMKPMAFLMLIFTFWSVPAQSADETPGQVLGGSLDSPVRLEVFSDFQCPACRELYLGTIRPVLKEYASKNKVCVIYHEYPLSIHQYAREAARYSEAASRLGLDRLLPVLDSLFTEQAQWSQNGSLEATVAKALPLEDFQKLKKLMQDASINSAIEKQVELGVKRDVKSTPTMFIYYIGKQQKVEGLVTYLVMKQFIDSIVK